MTSDTIVASAAAPPRLAHRPARSASGTPEPGRLLTDVAMTGHTHLLRSRVGDAGRCVAVAMLVLASSTLAYPQAAHSPADQGELARKLANPISDLVSVPFQFNWEQNVGPSEATRFILNVQPVMPFSISSDWNMIARVIVPFVSQPALFDGGTPAFGVSDVLTSFFFSPKRGAIVWGVGPVISLPSTSIPTLGSEKWAGGPTAIALKQAGPLTAGALWNQVWSFAGNDQRADVSQMFLQPFLAYQATPTVTLTLQSEATANWKVDEGRWTVPITVSVSKLSSLGVFPASYQIGFGGYAVHGDVGPSWKARGAVVIMLPKGR